MNNPATVTKTELIGEDGKPLFRWTVEIDVSETWVEDGFDLTKDRLKTMIDEALPFAYENETAVRIVGKPSEVAIREAQGYQ